MDWLRSEDLKEEKVLTTSTSTLTRQERISSFQMGPVNGFDCLSNPLLTLKDCY